MDCSNYNEEDLITSILDSINEKEDNITKSYHNNLIECYECSIKLFGLKSFKKWKTNTICIDCYYKHEDEINNNKEYINNISKTIGCCYICDKEYINFSSFNYKHCDKEFDIYNLIEEGLIDKTIIDNEIQLCYLMCKSCHSFVSYLENKYNDGDDLYPFISHIVKEENRNFINKNINKIKEKIINKLDSVFNYQKKEIINPTLLNELIVEIKELTKDYNNKDKVNYSHIVLDECEKEYKENKYKEDKYKEDKYKEEDDEENIHDNNDNNNDDKEYDNKVISTPIKKKDLTKTLFVDSKLIKFMNSNEEIIEKELDNIISFVNNNRMNITENTFYKFIQFIQLNLFNKISVLYKYVDDKDDDDKKEDIIYILDKQCHEILDRNELTISRDKTKLIPNLKFYKINDLIYSQYINYNVKVSKNKQKILYKRNIENFVIIKSLMIDSKIIEFMNSDDETIENELDNIISIVNNNRMNITENTFYKFIQFIQLNLFNKISVSYKYVDEKNDIVVYTLDKRCHEILDKNELIISRDKTKLISEIMYYKIDDLTYSQYINYTVRVLKNTQKALYKRNIEDFVIE